MSKAPEKLYRLVDIDGCVKTDEELKWVESYQKAGGGTIYEYQLVREVKPSWNERAAKVYSRYAYHRSIDLLDFYHDPVWALRLVECCKRRGLDVVIRTRLSGWYVSVNDEPGIKRGALAAAIVEACVPVLETLMEDK